MGNICTKQTNNREFASKTAVNKAYTKQYIPDSKYSKDDRRVTITNNEVITAKIMVQSDRIETRLEGLKKQEKEIDSKIKDLISLKKKDEAYIWLRRKAEVKRRIKDARVKIEFLDKQLSNLENATNDLEFSKVVTESNRLIEKLTSEIDRDEIVLAKQLQDESAARKEEIMAMLEDDDDDEIRNQIDEMERLLGSQSKTSGLSSKNEPKANTKAEKQVVVSELLQS